MPEFSLPDWFTSDQAPDQPTRQIVDSTTRILVNEEPQSIMETARLIFDPEDLYSCNKTFLFILYKIFIFKGLSIPEKTESEKEFQIQHILLKFLFPSEYKNLLDFKKAPKSLGSLPGSVSPPQSQLQDARSSMPLAPAPGSNHGGNTMTLADNAVDFEGNRTPPDVRLDPEQIPHASTNPGPQRRYADRYEVPRDVRGNPIYGEYDIPANPYGPGAPDNFSRRSQPPSRPANGHNASQQNSATSSFAPCDPLPSHTQHSRPSDMSRYYNKDGATYTGKITDNGSLYTHKRKYYKYCRLARLNAREGLDCLVHMIEPGSMAYTYYIKPLSIYVNGETLSTMTLRMMSRNPFRLSKISTNKQQNSRICSLMSTNTNHTYWKSLGTPWRANPSFYSSIEQHAPNLKLFTMLALMEYISRNWN